MKNKAKAQYTERRFVLRGMLWNRVKGFIQWHIQTTRQGTASRLARMVGVTPSQIHRFTCPVCEHDQEPTFTVGMAVFLAAIIDRQQEARTIDLPESDVRVVTLRRIKYVKGVAVEF